ncbi:MAG TPA: GDP-mannose 4,6-dehydratase, partial [Acidobacteriota bacterium]|nr:GDP-mannose 4,6-dehydratase [Acidobacteriota bacterium]
MKIFVTGGAGFIGSHVADAFLNLGHKVVIFDNLSTGRRENLNPQAKFIEGDLGDDSLPDILKAESPDVISHHAAQIDVRKSVTDPRFDAQVNILGSIHLLEAARQAGVKH